MHLHFVFFFFFFNDTATTEIYTLSLHDALPISKWSGRRSSRGCSRRAAASSTSTCAPSPPCNCRCAGAARAAASPSPRADRKSTRLNSSHLVISYAVFCLKKKKKDHREQHRVNE